MISIILILGLILYILIFRFVAFKKVDNCKSLFTHIPSLDSKDYTGLVSSYNPSIVDYKGKKITSIRVSTNGTMYYHLDTIVNMSMLKIEDNYIDTYFDDNQIKDIRLFSLYDNLYGLGSINKDNTIKPVIMMFSEDLTRIDKVDYITSDDTIKGIPAKNWILIERGDEVLVQTDIYPEFVVQKISKSTLLEFQNLHIQKYKNSSRNIKNILKLTNDKLESAKIHGTSNWIRLSNGNYLTIVHSFYQALKTVKYARRIYRNMFVEIDYDTLEITRFSDFVCFTDVCDCIQFATALHREASVITVGLGVDDYYSKFVKYNENEIIKSLIHN